MVSPSTFRTATPAINGGKQRHWAALSEFGPAFLNGVQRSVNRKVQGSNPCSGASRHFVLRVDRDGRFRIRKLPRVGVRKCRNLDLFETSRLRSPRLFVPPPRPLPPWLGQRADEGWQIATPSRTERRDRSPHFANDNPSSAVGSPIPGAVPGMQLVGRSSLANQLGGIRGTILASARNTAAIASSRLAPLATIVQAKPVPSNSSAGFVLWERGSTTHLASACSYLNGQRLQAAKDWDGFPLEQVSPQF